MSISACPSMTPLIPLSAWCLASRTSLRERKILKSNAMITTISGPPANSASANCQPISTMRIMLNSATRLVEASSKAIAAVKSAPFRKIDPVCQTNFSLRWSLSWMKIKCDEKLRENLVVDSGCCHVHHSICGGQTELQKDRQKLSHE